MHLLISSARLLGKYVSSCLSGSHSVPHAMLRSLTAFLCLLVICHSFATTMTVYATPIPFVGGIYAQTFDSLPNTKDLAIFKDANVGAFNLDSTFHASFATTNLQGWQMWKSALLNNNDAAFRTGTGAGASNGVYSFGLALDSERALGILSTDSGSYSVGLILENGTASTIDHFYLEYFGEQWRRVNSNSDKKLTFDFAIGTTIQSIVSTTSEDATLYKPVPELDFERIVKGSPVGAIDGNDDANRVKITHKVENINWQPGEFLVLRWTDENTTFDDPALAIDDLKFSVDIAHAPEPSALVMAGMAASGLLFLMRKHVLRRRPT